ncbi:pentapeptide repeat-containing protein [Streptomyces sp. NPDC047123]|uniref:pentapeptide repeat-containing protein n=1 Tax=Streptomyces sp. NPDC047123 TaxID=3155622 RepID=UPI00340D2E70
MSQARRKPNSAQMAAADAEKQRRRTRNAAIRRELRKLRWWTVSLASLATFALLFWKGPWWIDGTHIRESDLQPADGVVITGFRTGLVALAAGLVAGAGLWYTHKNHQHTEKLFEHTRDKDREQAELTREGQVTGRYVEAIKLLASDKEHEQLGGIYSLERIMRDSDKDRFTVLEVLAAYARSNLSRPVDPDEAAPQPSVAPGWDGGGLLVPLPEVVRAVLAVLARNWRAKDRWYPDLRSLHLAGRDASEIDLSGAWLAGANLENCFLPGAKLKQAQLIAASLSGARMNRVQAARAILKDADFDGADLQDGNFEEANLRNSLLTQARLSRAQLSRADMSGANLEGADLSEANLWGTQLADVNFDGANLTDANLHRAKIEAPLNLTVEQLCRACIYPSTKLPDALSVNPQIRDRIAQCLE